MTLPPMDPTPDLVRRWKSDRQLVTDGDAVRARLARHGYRTLPPSQKAYQPPGLAS